ncbi:MAG: RNA polymerase sigma factor [Pseudomonadota bacterium]
MSKSGKQPKIEAALRKHTPELRRFVAARTPHSNNYADVDDVLQSAALRAVERADSLQDPAKVLPWLYQIHRNVVTDLQRKQASEDRRKDAFASDMMIGDTDMPEHCACSLSQAGKLSQGYSAILELVDIKGASLKEAARSLNLTVNNAGVRLHRARAALKRRLLAHCGVSTMRECADCRCTSDGCCPT